MPGKDAISTPATLTLHDAPSQYELDFRAREVPLPYPVEINRFAGLSPFDLTESEQREIARLALSLLEMRHQRGQLLSSPDLTRTYLRLRLAELKNELFGILYLDNRHRILADETLFHGSIDGCSVHPRVVAQRCLEHNAGAVILYHNHPSGIAEPSQADQQITNRLLEALKLFEVRVLDHLIVSAAETVSFAERGLI